MEPKLSSRHFRAQLAALEQLGYDGEALLAQAGLTRAALEEADARFSSDAHVAMLTAAMKTRPIANLALELARHVPLGAYEVVDYLALTSETVAAGMRQLARYFRLISDRVKLQLREQDGLTRLEVVAPAFAVEYCTALTLINLQRTAPGFSAVCVSFSHRPDDVDAYARCFGCPALAQQSWSGFAASTDAWSRPMERRDPMLQRVLEQHATGLLRELPDLGSLPAQVRSTIAAALPSGGATIDEVARRLGMSARSLQRRLAEAGNLFQHLHDDVARGLAERYLRDPKLSVGEVAYLLGYSEPSAFHRAFRRWTGITPKAFRAPPPA